MYLYYTLQHWRRTFSARQLPHPLSITSLAQTPAATLCQLRNSNTRGQTENKKHIKHNKGTRAPTRVLRAALIMRPLRKVVACAVHPSLLVCCCAFVLRCLP